MNTMKPQVRFQKLKDATVYPLYCPNCGARRQEQDEAPRPPLQVETTTQTIYQDRVGKAREAVEFCLRCGFLWASLARPEEAFNQRLQTMTDQDLLTTLKVLYPILRNMVKGTAERCGQSLGHVQRVLEGDRKSAHIDRELAKEFRSRLEEAKIGRLL